MPDPALDALFLLHSRIPRGAPGSDSSTLKALSRLAPLPPDARVLDLGCGAGRQTLVLARALQRPVIAVDIHQPYLDQLRRDASDTGLSLWIETRNCSMDALPDPPHSYDLIWSEGAVYNLGVPQAARLWRPLLRPGGSLVFTELTWLAPQPPAEPARFWNAAYPAMATVERNRAALETAGYQVIDAFPLPPEDWWTEYYTPLEARIADLRPASRDNPALAQVLDATAQEIDLYRCHGDTYGYVFYVACITIASCAE